MTKRQDNQPRSEDPEAHPRPDRALAVSEPNASGVLQPGYQEIVARHGSGWAEIHIALAADGLYRAAPQMDYALGCGFSDPIRAADAGYPTFEQARLAGLEALLRRWPVAAEWDPAAVHETLDRMRRKIEALLRQPDLI